MGLSPLGYDCQAAEPGFLLYSAIIVRNNAAGWINLRAVAEEENGKVIISTVISILFVLAVHEAGHALAIILTRAGQVKGLVLSLRGIGVEWEPYGYDPAKRSVVSLSGSAVNIIFAVIFFATGLYALGLANLIFGVMNLMPLPGSDGSRAFASLKEAA